MFRTWKELSVKYPSRYNFTILTGDIEGARRYLKDYDLKGSVEVKSVAYDEIPKELCQHDIGWCLIQNSIAKSVCYPVKITEYLASSLNIVYNCGIGDLEEILEGYSHFKVNLPDADLATKLSKWTATLSPIVKDDYIYLSWDENIESIISIYR